MMIERSILSFLPLPPFLPFPTARASGLEHLQCLARRARPTVPREDGCRRRENTRTRFRVEQRALESAGCRREIALRDIDGGIAAGFTRHGRVEHHWRNAGCERLDRRQAEPLVLRQKR